MFDMFGMMGKIKDAQENLKKAQDNLALVTIETEAGAGMVKVKINGKKQILGIQVDPSIYNDQQMTQDLIVAAVNKAIAEVEVISKEEMKKSLQGVLPNIPGLDLESLLGGR